MKAGSKFTTSWLHPSQPLIFKVSWKTPCKVQGLSLLEHFLSFSYGNDIVPDSVRHTEPEISTEKLMILWKVNISINIVTDYRNCRLIPNRERDVSFHTASWLAVATSQPHPTSTRSSFLRWNTTRSADYSHPECVELHHQSPIHLHMCCMIKHKEMHTSHTILYRDSYNK